MIPTKILRHPLIIQTESHLFGSQAEGWNLPLSTSDSLPRFAALEDALPDSIWKEPTAALLLPEIACFPIKVKVEQKIAERDRETYLKWNLKKRLPFPAEDAVIQFLPLADTDHWLVFSLPNAWVQETFAFFKTKKVHLGYIGTLAGLFLERFRTKNGAILLAYEHYYVYLEKAGDRTRHFQVRRFPEENGEILFPEFFPSDFSGRSGESMVILNFSAVRSPEWHSFLNSQPQLKNTYRELNPHRESPIEFIKSLGGRS